MKYFTLPLIALSTFAFTGCVEREAADAKLVKGCEAAILAFSDEGDKVGAINKQTITDHAKQGPGHREVKLDVTITDGFHGRDESHSCIFYEQFGMFKSTHNASIYQLNYFGKIIGKDGFDIHGSVEEMQKLTDAVDKALR